MEIRPGKYRHFKGGEYEVLGIATHSETLEPMVVYRALYGEKALWVRPAAMWGELVERGGVIQPRFAPMEGEEEPLLFVCLPSCSTCRRARDFLNSRGWKYTARDIRQEPPTEEELLAWQRRGGLPWRRFFNTSGASYKNLRLRERLAGLSEAEQLQLLAGDPMLVKRPILVSPNWVLLGFRETEWAEKLPARL